jgi:non-heme chloroperoxidase
MSHRTDTGRCDIRKENYYLDACPHNRDHHRSNPGKRRNPVRLFIQDYGHPANPVIVIPDGVLSPQMTQYQIKPLVDAGFRVIAINPRGMGVSDKPGPSTPYNLDVWADDLASILKQLDIKTINTLVGSTPTSRISLRYLTRHGCCKPKVERLFFHSPNALPAPAALIEPLKAAVQVKREDVIETLTQTVFSPVVISEAQDDWANQMQFNIPPWVWVDLFSTFQLDMTNELPGVCAPLIGILGSNDAFTPVPVAQAYVDAVPNGALVVVPGQGHALPQSDPVSFNTALISFAKAPCPKKYVQALKTPPVQAPLMAAALTLDVGSSSRVWTGWNGTHIIDQFGRAFDGR